MRGGRDSLRSGERGSSPRRVPGRDGLGGVRGGRDGLRSVRGGEGGGGPRGLRGVRGGMRDGLDELGLEVPQHLLRALLRGSRGGAGGRERR